MMKIIGVCLKVCLFACLSDWKRVSNVAKSTIRLCLIDIQNKKIWERTDRQ